MGELTMMRNSLILFFAMLSLCAPAQQKISGVVYDAVSNETLPFATIKFDEKGHGIIAGLNGEFEFDRSSILSGSTIAISYMGYMTQQVNVTTSPVKIYLQPLKNTLTEVVVKPPYDRIRHILDAAIANKSNNDPDKYDWYRCRIYYKMLIDVVPPVVVGADTAADKIAFRKFLRDQHLLMSETYSIRTWKKPQQLQEDVIGSRFSGLKRSMFTSLVTDVLPFHSYGNYINLNGKDYHNPVSKGYEQYYKFDIVDELMEGTDTVWMLSFRPRGQNANELEGKVYINSDGYAISDLVASSADTMLKRNVRLEQQYDRVTADGITHWFPAHLNYIIDWDQVTQTKTGPKTITYHLKGNSLIDSVSWKEDKQFHFDKTHTVRLRQYADELTDSTWKQMRPVALDDKDARSYRIIDSFGSKKHFDGAMDYMSRLPEAKIPVGIFDIDLKRFFSSNYYENVRLGAGAQTNEKLIHWLSIGGWAGYGFKDAHWKYGLFTEAYLDEEHEFSIRAAYTDDINDPGRIHLHPDLDKNYLNTYLLQKVDEVKSSSLGIKKKFDYWTWELIARRQKIDPRYTYALVNGGEAHNTFSAQELALNFRYAFAERTAPYFGRYYPVTSKYPIWYGKVTTGALTSGSANVPYTQVISAIVWHKHIDRIGYEHFLVEGGLSRSSGNLPLSKLFAGNGYRYDQGSATAASLYTFGGFMTMFPYEYYSDRFFSLVFRHDFDWKLYKVQIPHSKLSSAPFIGLQYNMLYGTLRHPEAQQLTTFSVPDNAYHEAGLLLNNILRINYLNLYYFTLNTGYYYHIADKGTGKLVIGAGVEF